MMLCCTERCREVAEAFRDSGACACRIEAFRATRVTSTATACRRRPANGSNRRTRTPASRGRSSGAAARTTSSGRCSPRIALFATAPGAAMTPSERGRVLWRSATRSADNAPRLAEIERRDNGKLACRGRRRRFATWRDYFRYYAGFADKVESAVIADRQEGRVRVHEVRAERRGRDHHAMELAADADELEARAGAGSGLHRGGQAVRIHVGVDARVRGAASRRRGLARTASSTSSPGSAPKSAKRW